MYVRQGTKTSIIAATSLIHQIAEKGSSRKLRVVSAFAAEMNKQTADSVVLASRYCSKAPLFWLCGIYLSLRDLSLKIFPKSDCPCDFSSVRFIFWRISL